MNYFPKLSQREGTVELPDGRALKMRLLPVRFLDMYLSVLHEVADDPQKQADGRKRLRELILRVWPREQAEALYHFDYIGTTRLCQYLFFGDDDGKNGTETKDGKGGSIAESADMEFIAARIINAFQSYTFESLMDEPVPVFFRLSLLANRIQADNALSMVTAIAAGLGDKDAAKDLRKLRGTLTVGGQTSPEKINYSQDALQDAFSRMEAPQNIITTAKRGGIIE